MIQEFVDRFISAKDAVKNDASELSYPCYEDLFRIVIKHISDEDEYGTPDVDRITVIDHGDYQGFLVMTVGASGYQPSTYWVTDTYYGSCSGCDELCSINDNGDWDSDGKTEEQAELKKRQEAAKEKFNELAKKRKSREDAEAAKIEAAKKNKEAGDKKEEGDGDKK